MKYSGLAGRSVLITGGSSGIGYAVANAFLEQEAEVHVTGTKKDGKGPHGSIFHSCDFSNSENLENLCDSLKELFDTIGVEYTLYKYNETDDKNLSFKTNMKIHTGGRLFPFCYFNGRYVGGYRELHQNLITGKLQEQLNEIGIEYEEDF